MKNSETQLSDLNVSVQKTSMNLIYKNKTIIFSASSDIV